MRAPVSVIRARHNGTFANQRIPTAIHPMKPGTTRPNDEPTTACMRRGSRRSERASATPTVANHADAASAHQTTVPGVAAPSGVRAVVTRKNPAGWRTPPATTARSRRLLKGSAAPLRASLLPDGVSTPGASHPGPVCAGVAGPRRRGVRGCRCRRQRFPARPAAAGRLAELCAGGGSDRGCIPPLHVVADGRPDRLPARGLRGHRSAGCAGLGATSGSDRHQPGTRSRVHSHRSPQAA